MINKAVLMTAKTCMCEKTFFIILPFCDAVLRMRKMGFAVGKISEGANASGKRAARRYTASDWPQAL